PRPDKNTENNSAACHESSPFCISSLRRADNSAMENFSTIFRSPPTLLASETLDSNRTLFVAESSSTKHESKSLKCYDQGLAGMLPSLPLISLDPHIYCT